MGRLSIGLPPYFFARYWIKVGILNCSVTLYCRCFWMIVEGSEKILCLKTASLSPTSAPPDFSPPPIHFTTTPLLRAPPVFLSQQLLSTLPCHFSIIPYLSLIRFPSEASPLLQSSVGYHSPWTIRFSSFSVSSSFPVTNAESMIP